MSAVSRLAKRGSKLLDAGDPVGALEALTKAESLARREGDLHALCGILGDRALAFRKVGNPHKAAQINQEAIDLCRSIGDTLNESRWTTNLLALHLDEGDDDAAERLMDPAIDAAKRTGRPDHVSIALGHAGILLERRRRYADAAEHLRLAEENSGNDPSLADYWRRARLVVHRTWAERLQEERRLAEAAEQWRTVLDLARPAQPDDLSLVAVAHSQLARLAWDSADQLEALDQLRLAREAFSALGDQQALAGIDAILAHPTDLAPGASGESSEVWRARANAAAQSGDKDSEVIALVNLAGELLAEDSPEAVAAFEEALMQVRRRGDRRYELVLLLNFCGEFVRLGQIERAVRQAGRAVTLARGLDRLTLATARLVRGEVYAEGQHDSQGAVASYRAALEALAPLADEDIVALKPKLVDAAQMALRYGNATVARDLLVRAGVQLTGTPTPMPAPSQGDLRDASDGVLTELLDGWPHLAEDGGEEVRSDFVRLAGIFGWERTVSRLLSDPEEAVTSLRSHAGGAMLRLGDLIAGGVLATAGSRRLAEQLDLPDEDLTVLGVLVLGDRRRAENGAMSATLRLAAEVAASAELAVQLGRAVATLAQAAGTIPAARAAVEAALSRLGDGVHEALRALMLNEDAVLRSQQGDVQGSLARAREALSVALEVGAADLVLKARGNEAVALMNLNRLDEAHEALVELARDQEAAGDAAGLEVTRFNLGGLELKLAALHGGRPGDSIFVGDSDDPDHVLMKAVEVGLVDRDLDRSALLFQRGLRLLEDRGDGSPSAASSARSDYARVLHDLGRDEEAVRQLSLAAASLEEDDNQEELCNLYLRMAELLHGQPARARSYAARAVALASDLDPAVEALALGVLGQIELADNDPTAAVAHLEQAVLRSTDRRLRLPYARALAAVGRVDDALSIFTGLAAEDDTEAAELFMGAAEAFESQGDRMQQEWLLQMAYARASQADVEVRVIAGIRLASVVSEVGRPAEAADLLDTVILEARAAGLQDAESAALMHLGVALEALGMYPMARTLLADVVERARQAGNASREMRAIFALGNCALHGGDFEEAFAQYQQALGLAGDDRSLEAACLDSLGATLRRLGQPGRAVDYSRQAARYHADIGNKQAEVRDRTNIVHALVDLRDVDGATEALAGVQALASPDDSFVLVAQARVAALVGNWTEAREVFRSLLRSIQSTRAALTAPVEQRYWATRVAETYGIALEAAVDAGDARSAVEFAECSRAAFLHAMVDRRRSRPSSVDEEVWRRYEEAADALAELRMRRRASLLDSPYSDTVDEALQQARRRYFAAAEQVGAAGASAQDPPDIPDFEHLVEPIRPGCAVAFLDQQGDKFTAAVAFRDESGRADARAGRGDAQSPQSVWAVLLELLPLDCKSVTLVPAGNLTTLPLHTARLPDRRLAGERLKVTYAPSLQVLAAVASQRAKRSNLLGQVVDARTDLPLCRCEAADVAVEHQGPVEDLTGPEACVEDVVSLLRDADIVHIAGHGAADLDDPLRTSIDCADGPLTIARLIRETRTLNPRLIVLASCDSGTASTTDALGMASMLIACGVRLALSTMWRVDDLATALLIREFFRRGGSGRDPASALAEAQAWLREEVTVTQVQQELQQWRAARPDDMAIQQLADEWAALPDDGIPPFEDDLFWAPFCLTGVLDGLGEP
jgi:tetratricopeptide (TPR) repeat protein